MKIAIIIEQNQWVQCVTVSRTLVHFSWLIKLLAVRRLGKSLAQSPASSLLTLNKTRSCT